MLLSIISPIYKGEYMLAELVSRCEAAAAQVTQDYELVLVNDCSPDASWPVMRRMAESDSHVRAVNLSRNFGQHAAITAGLTVSRGEWVVVLDCDLQDRPEEIPALWAKAREGYDTVFAEITERDDRFLKKFTSRLFSRFFAYMSGTRQGPKTNNFGIYSRQVVDAVLAMGDYIRAFPLQVRWVGFRIGYHPVVKDARLEGSSGYTWAKLFALAFYTVMAFSNKPLRMAVRLGTYITLLSLALAAFYLVRYLVGGISVSGFTTIVISLWLIAGMLIALIGIVGIYVGNVFDKVKGRPVFIIRETLNDPEP